MLDQLKHKRKMKNNIKLQHHSKGQRSLVLQKSRPQRFRGIPRRFREMLLEANLRETLQRFRGLEVQHLKTLRTSKKISKGMLGQVHLNLKLMKMMKTNLYTNLLDHLTPMYIKLYNGITPLTISLRA
jgi:transcriptional antiterminator